MRDDEKILKEIFEKDGRTFAFSDDKIVIGLNKRDTLEIAKDVYRDYVRENSSLTFKQWLEFNLSMLDKEVENEKN